MKRLIIVRLLRDKTRPSRIPPLQQTIIDRVIALTATEPPHQATHWTAAAMAKATGISVSSVQRIWRAHKLQPHRVRSFKLSTDPQFAARLRDIAGLYIDPPAHAVVLSVDEKSQIQALDRTQPGLPLKNGRCATMTHDYKRHGTTTLFAALDVLEGKVIGRCMQRHRHQEFIRFLNGIEATVPVGKVVHVILDNYATHKHPKVKTWLERHPRFVFHFTPTSCSWLNAVEGFFAKLTKRRLQRGVFRSIIELQAAINRFIEEANHDPKPFVWTGNPLAERRQERLTVPTFERAARAVHAEHSAAWKNPKHAGAMDQHARRVCLSGIRRPPCRSHRYSRRAQGAVADLADEARDRATRPAAHRHRPR